MTDHRNWALVTAFILLILTLWSIKLYRADKKQNRLFVFCLVVATSLLSITGWKGAEAVYRYGLGVMSLPNPDSHQHTGKSTMPGHHDSNMQNSTPHTESHEMPKSEKSVNVHSH